MARTKKRKRMRRMTRKRTRAAGSFLECLRMTASILSFAALISSAVPASGQEEANDGSAASTRESAIASNLVERIAERYESENSYRITFHQQSYWALADTSMYSDGVLLLERPARLSVRYDDGSLVVSDGETLRVYLAQTNQYFTSDIGEGDTVIDPPRVLRQFVPDPHHPYAGPENIADAAGRIRAASAVTRATLFLVAADGAGEPARLEVVIDPSRSLVIGMTAHTRSGDFTRYDITNTQFGVQTTPGDFAFKTPPGAERVGG